MKILITGGAGFVGSHLVDYFIKNYNYEIIVLDNMSYAANFDNIKQHIENNSIKFVLGDVNNYSLYSKILKDVSLVIHTAAESHVDNSFISPLSFSLTNTLGAHIFLLKCIKSKVKKIVHVSSDEVYGEKLLGKCNEKQKIEPTNPYSASKAAAEIFINSYKYAYKKEIMTVRGNNIYGIRQYPEKLIPRCIISLLRNKKIPIHGNGKNQRFYLSAHDFAKAIILLIKKKNSGIYNIGSNESYSNIDLAKLICKYLNKNPKKFISFVKDRPYNDKRYSISSLKIRKLGWKPKFNLIKELPNIIQWYSDNLYLYKGFK